MIFVKKGKLKEDNWHYNEQKIEEVKEMNYLYLGLQVTYNGTWKRHIEETINKGKRMINELRKHLYKFKEQPTEITKKAFTAIIEPAKPYGAEIWGLSKEAKDIDKTIYSLAKSTLGVKKSTHNLTALKELGWSKTSSKATIRVLNITIIKPIWTYGIQLWG